MSERRSNRDTSVRFDGAALNSYLFFLCKEQSVVEQDESSESRVQCDICGDTMRRYEMIRLPECKHLHCVPCLERNFDQAIKAKTLAYCCKEIDSCSTCRYATVEPSVANAETSLARGAIGECTAAIAKSSKPCSFLVTSQKQKAGRHAIDAKISWQNPRGAIISSVDAALNSVTFAVGHGRSVRVGRSANTHPDNNRYGKHSWRLHRRHTTRAAGMQTCSMHTSNKLS
ncbi:hypothetical protein ABW21_db0207141 [Orbilia brochopaga]|nr:hypothetical protein ABW21_db0207141 [Drechslerella brochopaga]